MSAEAALLPLAVFVLRVVNSSLFTVRMVVITHHQRGVAALLAGVEALIFAITIAFVVTDLTNIPILVAYTGGFAVGNYVGMMLEERFITSYVTVSIVANNDGHEMATALRRSGFGVTETLGEGRDGTVTMLRSVILRRDLKGMIDHVHTANPKAFVSVEEARAVHRGWLRAARHQK